MHWIRHEARGPHGDLHEWVFAQCSGIHCEVTVLGGLGECHVGAPGAQINSLRANHNHSVTVLGQSLQGVQHRGARPD